MTIITLVKNVAVERKLLQKFNNINDDNKKMYRSAEREQCRYYLGYIFLLP